MGHSLDFLCPACGLRGLVSGGEDAGMSSGTTTIYCEACETLQDAVTRRYLWDEERIITKPPRCERRSKHVVRLWTRDQPCPRCGSDHIGPDPQGREVLWD